jgi:hypothetical protein
MNLSKSLLYTAHRFHLVYIHVAQAYVTRQILINLLDSGLSSRHRFSVLSAPLRACFARSKLS